VTRGEVVWSLIVSAVVAVIVKAVSGATFPWWLAILIGVAVGFLGVFVWVRWRGDSSSGGGDSWWE
jgi:hypothetical protein